MQTEHICDWYAAIAEVYQAATTELNLPMAHIAEFYLERWWQVFSKAHRWPEFQLECASAAS